MKTKNIKSTIIILTKNKDSINAKIKSNHIFSFIYCDDLKDFNSILKSSHYKAIATDSLDFLLYINEKSKIIDPQIPILFFHQDCSHLSLNIKNTLKNQIWHFNLEDLNNKHLIQFYFLHITMLKQLQIESSDCYHYTFKSSMEKIEVVATHLNEYLDRMINQNNKIYIFYVNLILRELLTNSVKHGNKYDKLKDIYIIIYFSEDLQKIGILVKDEGNGFDFKNALDSIETDELRLQQRGLYLIKKLCDKIYNHKNLIAVELYYTE